MGWAGPCRSPGLEAKVEPPIVTSSLPSRATVVVNCALLASQLPTMCRIVLKRGRNEHEMPKGLKDAQIEQGSKSVIFCRAVPASSAHCPRAFYVALACIHSRKLYESLLIRPASRGEWRLVLVHHNIKYQVLYCKGNIRGGTGDQW